MNIITQLERLLQQYAVPMAYIDGRAVVKLAKDDLSEATREDLLECIANIDQVSQLLNIPGQRFSSASTGRDLAATMIQSTWRGHIIFAGYSQYQRARNAAQTIQEGWRRMVEYHEARENLLEHRRSEEDRWQGLVKRLADRWSHMKRKRRVIIHVPSISREEHHRASIPHFSTRQNAQLARLCACADPLVDVLYVSPFELPPDVIGYWLKLLEVGGIDSPDTRFRVLVPENAERFPPYLSLTSQILYSPRCIKRIKRFIKGRDAVIIAGNGAIGPEERRLALALDTPLLGPEPSIAALYSTKSGAKRLLPWQI